MRLFSIPLCIALTLLSPLIAKAQLKPVHNPVPVPKSLSTPPRSFEAIAVSSTEIRCYWLPAEGATGYVLMRDGQKLADLPKDTTEYDDTKLIPESTHDYSLRAISQDKTSDPRAYVERTFAEFPPSKTQPAKFDVVIVQASSGGVAAAYEAARRGLKVALLEPTTRFGGMPVNGLSATDLRRDYHASGFFTKFRDRVQALYAIEGIKTDGTRYEPRISHQAMKSLLYDVSNLTLYRRVRLSKVKSETTGHGRKKVTSVIGEELDSAGKPTGKRAEFTAKVFIDSTDCGDLAAWAGAAYRIGREARSPDEPHNGVIYYDRKNDKYLPGSTGAGDKRMQSYGYLLTVKDYGKEADKTIPMPPNYSPKDFDHSPAWKDSWALTSGKLPADKYELNQHPQGGDLQEINYKYAEGDYRERDRVEKLYRDRVLGYLYWLQTAQGQKSLGLPDDEYRDNGGFPPLLYTREGRRILAETVPTERDITQAKEKTFTPNSIGIGDYPMDSHAVRVKTDWSSPDMGEGEWWLFQQTPVYGIPLGVTIPRTLDNVFVTTAVSSTHVSFGTFRMEPVRMAFGQASAIAADYCIRFDLRAKDVPVRQVQDELLPRFSNVLGDTQPFLTFFMDLKPTARYYNAIQYLSARGIRPAKLDEFKPEAPVTEGELATWLTLLSQRGSNHSASAHSKGAEVDPYLGRTANESALQEMQKFEGSSLVATRGEFVHWVAKLFPVSLKNEEIRPRYSDVGNAESLGELEILAHYGTDATLWDSWSAYAPDGGLLLRPEASLRRDDLFASLYLLQFHLGPLFRDNPRDRR